MRVAALILLLAGCFSSEDDTGAASDRDAFAVSYADAACGVYHDCGFLEDAGFADLASCTADIQASFAEDPDRCASYDSLDGQACISGLEGLFCADVQDGLWPAACERACPDGAADGSIGAQ